MIDELLIIIYGNRQFLRILRQFDLPKTETPWELSRKTEP